MEILIPFLFLISGMTIALAVIAVILMKQNVTLTNAYRGKIETLVSEISTTHNQLVEAHKAIDQNMHLIRLDVSELQSKMFQRPPTRGGVQNPFPS